MSGQMKSILLVEDNPDDELLTVRALKRNNVLNDIVVARDGVEALDYLFGTGSYAGRDLTAMPQIILEARCARAVICGVVRRESSPIETAKRTKS